MLPIWITVFHNRNIGNFQGNVRQRDCGAVGPHNPALQPVSEKEASGGELYLQIIPPERL